MFLIDPQNGFGMAKPLNMHNKKLIQGGGAGLLPRFGCRLPARRAIPYGAGLCRIAAGAP
jgi:hypothetical protein